MTGRPITMPGPIGDLARVVGGVNTLSVLLQTPQRTIRNWAHGSPIPGAARIAIDRLCESHSLPTTNHERGDGE